MPTGGYTGDAYPWAGLAASGNLPGHGFPGDTYAYGQSAATEVLDLGSLDDGGWASSISATGLSDTGRSRPGRSKSSFTNRDFTGGAFRSTPLRDEGYSPDGGTSRGSAHRRRKKKSPAPVRSGLLGVSAAVAFGTVAVATGAVPGLENYKLGGDSAPSDSVQAGGAPTNAPSEQGGASGGSLETPGREAGSQASRDGQRSTSPAPAPSTSETAPPEAPEKEDRAETPEKKPETEEAAGETAAPDKPGNSERGAQKGAASASENAAAAQVLALVNQERVKAGCRPLTPSKELAGLAAAFSEDMAKRGFFDHTDPDGATPWDRAERAGITDLGGENIARGQADAASVMQAWMDSPGHRANILNCDFKTLGVGVHFGPGGPWWTQNFGY
ncbi:CAP domain-containing protein [Streptomyces thermospinosisporus]|uniref:CAP domain-containing protein n=1 Tax=Streptomyces thermospinosisporus TaxID=161482 RepID=UPI003CD05F95